MVAVSRDLLCRVLGRMMEDLIRIDGEWGSPFDPIEWEDEDEIVEVAKLLGLEPGDWPEHDAITQRGNKP